MSYKLYNGDCLEIMKDIPDETIDLALIDPPYNIGKAKWDKWKTVDAYVEFMGQVFKECERVLKDNGSFYFFHNDFLQIVELQNYINKNTNFIFKQLLVWDKFNGSKWNQLNAIVYSESNRNYPKQAEYCLYYTFRDDTGLSKVTQDINNFTPIKDILANNLKKHGYVWNSRELLDVMIKIGKYKNEATAKIVLKHIFDRNYKQFRLLTKRQYDVLSNIIDWDFTYEELRQKYEYLRQEYEDLRQEYEDLRYTFNNQGLPSVLQHEPVKQNGHITPKPTDILEKIIKTSSNEGDLVLDCFMGSGSTGEACIKTKRNFIGIEKDEKYFKIAEDRLKNL